MAREQRCKIGRNSSSWSLDIPPLLLPLIVLEEAPGTQPDIVVWITDKNLSIGLRTTVNIKWDDDDDDDCDNCALAIRWT